MAEYIYRKGLNDRLKDFSKWCRDGRKEGVDFVLDCVLPDMPSADVATVKHGEWIRHKENCLYNRCSICSYEHCREDNYCPNCGAKMDGKPQKEV